MFRTLRRKVLIGYGIALALVALVLVWSLVNLRTLGTASEAILQENYRSALAAENMINALERQDSAILLLLLGQTERAGGQLAAAESGFLQWLGRAKDNVTIEGEQAIVDSLERSYTDYLQELAELRLTQARDPQAAAGLYTESVLPDFTSVRDQCVRLREINEQAMSAASKHASQVGRRAVWSTAVVGVSAVVAGLLFSLLLSALIARPLQELMAAARTVADGEYDIEVPRRTQDEIGQLAAEFNSMVRKLRGYHDLNLERLSAETQKSQAIIHTIDDGILLVDASLTVTEINPAAARALRTEPDEAVGRHVREVLSDEHLVRQLRAAAESGQAPSGTGIDRTLAVDHGAEARHYEYSIMPVRGRSGQMIGVILLLRDVTKLMELDRLKSEFVMTASHELRTPLHSVSMAVDLLVEGSADRFSEREKQLLEVAHEDLERLRALVNDLLDLSKIEAGRVELDIEPVPVSVLVDGAVAALGPQAEEKSVELTTRIADGTPKVRADANKVTWVLTNLIANAIRYTPTAGHIRVTVEPIGAQVHVSVSDDGAGIPPELQPRIFDKFVQVGDDKGKQGSGLGLAICREIVRAHGGTIWVDSRPGEGATFTFTLPTVG